jgi:hypothetical protein
MIHISAWTSLKDFHSKLQQKPPDLLVLGEHPALQNMGFFNFFYFLLQGHLAFLDLVPEFGIHCPI